LSRLSFGENILNENDEYTLFVRSLFQGLTVDTSNSELVEMMCVMKEQYHHNDANVFGIVQRHWVHQYNLLHRGIGVIVTKDMPIAFSTPQQHQLDVYCHQRASTKRIFPSLYDMFIGGISLVGEASISTALRDVAEELRINQNTSHQLVTTTTAMSNLYFVQSLCCRCDWIYH
jgi:hypothetical protein